MDTYVPKAPIFEAKIVTSRLGRAERECRWWSRARRKPTCASPRRSQRLVPSLSSFFLKKKGGALLGKVVLVDISICPTLSHTPSHTLESRHSRWIFLERPQHSESFRV